MIKLVSILVCCIVVCTAVCSVTAAAQTAEKWELWIADSLIGVMPWGSDAWNGDPAYITPTSVGVYRVMYHEHGPDWAGPTGFYPGQVYLTPIPPGGSRTWSDYYLWAQNCTPAPGALTHFGTGTDPYLPPPAGYTGHLVLDNVPDGYSGPSDYWLDLTQQYHLPLPIPVVTDPLQGTRFHLTVYAPVPEPSSLAALALGLVPLGIAGIRSRRRD